MTHLRRVTNAKEVAQLTETLKQKVQAKAQRIIRYKKRETQCSQNKMFKEDTKKFYRNLGMKNIQAREPPSVVEAETYWKSLWGEEAQHNERAEWIRREKKNKVTHMDWMLIQITEITSYLLKAHNWKFLEIIKYKITGLKLSQLLTGILQKTSMQ